MTWIVFCIIEYIFFLHYFYKESKTFADKFAMVCSGGAVICGIINFILLLR